MPNMVHTFLSHACAHESPVGCTAFAPMCPPTPASPMISHGPGRGCRCSPRVQSCRWMPISEVMGYRAGLRGAHQAAYFPHDTAPSRVCEKPSFFENLQFTFVSSAGVLGAGTWCPRHSQAQARTSDGRRNEGDSVQAPCSLSSPVLRAIELCSTGFGVAWRCPQGPSCLSTSGTSSRHLATRQEAWTSPSGPHAGLHPTPLHDLCLCASTV